MKIINILTIFIFVLAGMLSTFHSSNLHSLESSLHSQNVDSHFNFIENVEELEEEEESEDDLLYGHQSFKLLQINNSTFNFHYTIYLDRPRSIWKPPHIS